MKITAKAPKVGRELSVDYPLDGDLEELFGADGVEYLARRQAVTDIKNFMRARLNDGAKDEDIIAEVKALELGHPRRVLRSKDPVSAAKKLFLAMSDEEKQAFLAALNE